MPPTTPRPAAPPQRPRRMTEAMLEAAFRHRVRQAGGLVFKLAPTTKGIPDRLVLFPAGGMYLVELKTETGRVHPAQELWHQRAAQLGTPVYVLRGYDEMCRWVRGRMQRFDPLPGRPTGTGNGAAPRHGSAKTRWAPAEEQLLRDHDYLSNEELASKLGRTASAVGAKRRALRQASQATAGGPQ